MTVAFQPLKNQPSVSKNAVSFERTFGHLYTGQGTGLGDAEYIPKLLHISGSRPESGQQETMPA
jgi:hypothetical protein